MTNTPERIWLVPDGGNPYFYDKSRPGDVEYVRAELIEALEAENQKLRAALRECEDALDLHGKMYPAMVKGYTLDALNAARAALRKPKESSND